jgi:two-component system NtrC family sensor kinase
MSDAEAWRARFERERAARREAEALLHDKSRELYLAIESLSRRADELSASLEQLREAQDQLVQREKMAALGALVAGVAHEINTPLGVAVTAITHAAERVRRLDGAVVAGTLTRGDMRAFLNDMQEAVGLALDNLERGARLVQSFKKVAVDQSSEAPRDAQLEELATDVVASLRPITRHAGVTVEVVSDARTRVRIDAGALVQVLTNLVQNACVHAFDGVDGSRTVRIDLRPVGDAAEVILSDNGNGMDTDTAARVFEPFFTTRRSSGGSGLGMHIVHTIVTQRFLGTIALDTAPGRGTRWILRLPFGSPALARLDAG